MAGLLRDSDTMQHFVCDPQVKLTTCGERIYDEVTSATWFENEFNGQRPKRTHAPVIKNIYTGKIVIFQNCHTDLGS